MTLSKNPHSKRFSIAKVRPLCRRGSQSHVVAARKILTDKDKSKEKKNQYLNENQVQSKTPKYVEITNATKKTNQTQHTKIYMIKHKQAGMKINQSMFLKIDNMGTEVKFNRSNIIFLS